MIFLWNDHDKTEEACVFQYTIIHTRHLDKEKAGELGLSVCDDKDTIETSILLKFTNFTTTYKEKPQIFPFY